MLQYANNGTLREYLGNEEIFYSLRWKDKAQMALDITSGLMYLHEKGITHRNLVII